MMLQLDIIADAIRGILSPITNWLLTIIPAGGQLFVYGMYVFVSKQISYVLKQDVLGSNFPAVFIPFNVADCMPSKQSGSQKSSANSGE